MLPMLFQIQMRSKSSESSSGLEKVPRPWELRDDLSLIHSFYQSASWQTGQSRLEASQVPSVGQQKDTREWKSLYPVSLTNPSGAPLSSQPIEFDTAALSIAGNDVITTVSSPVFVGRSIEPSTQLTSKGKEQILPKAIATAIDQIQAWSFQPFLAATGSNEEAQALSSALQTQLQSELNSGRLSAAPFERAYTYMSTLMRNAAGLGSEPNDLAPSLANLPSAAEKAAAISIALNNFYYSVWDKSDPARFYNYFSQDHINPGQMYSLNRKAADKGAAELGATLGLPYQGAVFLSTYVPEKEKKDSEKMQVYDRILLSQLASTWIGIAALRSDAATQPLAPTWVSDATSLSDSETRIRLLAKDSWAAAERNRAITNSGLSAQDLDASLDATLARFSAIAASLQAGDSSGARHQLEGLENDIAQANYKGKSAFEASDLGGYFAMQSSLELCGRGLLFVPSSGAQMKSTYSTHLSDVNETDFSKLECRLEQDADDPAQFWAVGRWHVTIDISNPKQKVYAPNYKKFLAQLFTQANGEGFVVDEASITFNPKTGEFVLDGRMPFRLERESQLSGEPVRVYAPAQLKPDSGRLEIFSVKPRPLGVEWTPTPEVTVPEPARSKWNLDWRVSRRFSLLGGAENDQKSFRQAGSSSNEVNVSQRHDVSIPLLRYGGAFLGVSPVAANAEWYSYLGDTWWLASDRLFRVNTYAPVALAAYNEQLQASGKNPLTNFDGESAKYFLTNYTDAILKDQFWRVSLEDIHKNGGKEDRLYSILSDQVRQSFYGDQLRQALNRQDSTSAKLFGRQEREAVLDFCSDVFYFVKDGRSSTMPLALSFAKDFTTNIRQSIQGYNPWGAGDGTNLEWGMSGRSEGSGLTVRFPGLSGPWGENPVPSMDLLISVVPPIGGLNTVSSKVPGFGLEMELQNVNAVWGQLIWRLAEKQTANTSWAVRLNLSGGYFWPNGVRQTAYDSKLESLWSSALTAGDKFDYTLAKKYVEDFERRLQEITPNVGAGIPTEVQNLINDAKAKADARDQPKLHGALSGLYSWLYWNYLGTETSDTWLNVKRIDASGHTYTSSDALTRAFPMFEPKFADVIVKSRSDLFGQKDLLVQGQLDFSLPPAAYAAGLGLALGNSYMSSSEVYSGLTKRIPELDSYVPLTDYQIGALLRMPFMTDMVGQVAMQGNLNAMFKSHFAPTSWTVGLRYTHDAAEYGRSSASIEFTHNAQFGAASIPEWRAQVEHVLPNLWDRLWAKVGAEYGASALGSGASVPRFGVYLSIGGSLGPGSPKEHIDSSADGSFHPRGYRGTGGSDASSASASTPASSTSRTASTSAPAPKAVPPRPQTPAPQPKATAQPTESEEEVSNSVPPSSQTPNSSPATRSNQTPTPAPAPRASETEEETPTARESPAPRSKTTASKSRSSAPESKSEPKAEVKPTRSTPVPAEETPVPKAEPKSIRSTPVPEPKPASKPVQTESAPAPKTAEPKPAPAGPVLDKSSVDLLFSQSVDKSATSLMVESPDHLYSFVLAPAELVQLKRDGLLKKYDFWFEYSASESQISVYKEKNSGY